MEKTVSEATRTKTYFLIGNPVSHSLSPFIMNRAFGLMGFDCFYGALQVGAHGFEAAFRDLAAGCAEGANITFPYKEDVVPILDEMSDCVAVVSAANAIHFKSGAAVGYNTDATGLISALEAFVGFSPKDKRALIFGAGGAARAAAYGLLEARADSVKFCVRNPAKAEPKLAPLCDRFGPESVSIVSMGGAHRDARLEAVGDSDLLINATPLGMPGYLPWPRTGLIDAPSWIKAEHVCFDLVYGASGGWFAGDAERSGAVYLDGVSHLIAQASDGLRLWTGRGFDLIEMANAVAERVSASRLKNIERALGRSAAVRSAVRYGDSISDSR